MAETLATIDADGRAHGSDFEQIQVRRDGFGLSLWAKTTRGVVLLRDRAMLDQLARELRRRGFGAEQATLTVRDLLADARADVEASVGPDPTCETCGGHGKLVRERFTSARGRWNEAIACPRCGSTGQALEEGRAP